MGRERAHLGEMIRLFYAAGREAEAFGRRRVGTEHFLLAILASDGQPAATALINLGITRDAFAQALAADDDASDSAGDDPAASYGRPSRTSAAHELMGRAEGLAAGLSVVSVTCEHVLIAYVWDPSTSVDIEECFGVTREAVLEELSRLGVQLPRAPLPPRPLPSGARVYVPYDELMSVVNALRERLPWDSGLGFNHDGNSRAWVLAYREIDLEPEVRAVLDELGIDPGPVDLSDR